MKPAVIYARVSSKDQEREGYSIPARMKRLLDHWLPPVRIHHPYPSRRWRVTT
ncbi:MAG: hypothetical protein ACYDDI_10275 [Candidatus Acidiferrales bacterium]